MFGVRFHGRGGQGVVTAAELLAAAAFVRLGPCRYCRRQT
jgi:Pyruvate/2-oxoacid:ferredoxin oxidoreductase gamma subunit